MINEKLIKNPIGKGEINMINNNGMNIKRGDIYFADLDGAIGSEQGGKRPVIIVQNNIGNKYSPTVLAIPLTSRLTKAKLPTHTYLPQCITPLKTNSVALAEQATVLDKSRLSKFIGTLDNETMNKINTTLMIAYGLNQNNNELVPA